MQYLFLHVIFSVFEECQEFFCRSLVFSENVSWAYMKLRRSWWLRGLEVDTKTIKVEMLVEIAPSPFRLFLPSISHLVRSILGAQQRQHFGTRLAWVSRTNHLPFVGHSWPFPPNPFHLNLENYSSHRKHDLRGLKSQGNLFFSEIQMIEIALFMWLHFFWQTAMNWFRPHWMSLVTLISLAR